MMNVFQIAPNDQSLLYLGQVFGNVGIALSGTGPALLSSMFRIFNTALLVLGTLIVAYVTVVGVLRTAQEGEFLGRNWSTLWLPVRMVMGIVALMPTATGYCAIQVVLMWVIVQGIGAADMVWKGAVDYLSQGGMIKPPNPQDLGGISKNVISNIFEDLVCQATATKLAAGDATAYAHSQPYYDSSGNQIGYSFGRQRKDNDPPQVNTSGECGWVVWNSSAAGVTTQMQSAQQAAIQTLVPTLENVANNYVNSIIADAACWSDACTQDEKTNNQCSYFNLYNTFNPQNSACLINSTSTNPVSYPNANTFWTGLSNYTGGDFVSSATNLLIGYAYNYNTQGNTPVNLTGMWQTMYSNGWIYAGAYFYNIAQTYQAGSGNFNLFLGSINVNGATNGGQSIALINSGSGKTSIFNDLSSPVFGNVLQTVNQSAPAVLNVETVSSQTNVPTLSGPSTPGGLIGSLIKSMVNTIQYFAQIIGPQTQNPIVAMQSYGENLIVTSELLLWDFIAVGITVMAAGGASATFVLGSGTEAGLAIAWGSLALAIPVVMFFVGFMFTVGGLLGVYMPLLPYILFFAGTIGWFIAVIEAMVAAPLVAIGLLIPGGQSEIFGRAEHSLNLMLSIFLRPTLMVFGMMAALLLSNIVAQILNAAFFSIIGTFFVNGRGLFPVIIMILAYAGILLAILNKVFSLIHIVPDRVLAWIGHHGGAPGGEAEVAESAKGKVGAATAGAGQFASGASRSPESASRGIAGARKTMQEDANKKKAGEPGAANASANDQGQNQGGGRGAPGGGGGGGAGGGGRAGGGGPGGGGGGRR